MIRHKDGKGHLSARAGGGVLIKRLEFRHGCVWWKQFRSSCSALSLEKGIGCRSAQFKSNWQAHQWKIDLQAKASKP